MNTEQTRHKTWRGLMLATMAAAMTGFFAGQARATTNPAQLDIECSVMANLSVEVNGAAASTQTVTINLANPNDVEVPTSSATVLNNSGAQTEKWELQVATTSIDQGDHGSPGTWTNAGSTTAVTSNEFAVQAVFGSSTTAASTGGSHGCPAAAAADWNGAFAPALSNVQPQTYGGPSLINGTSYYVDTALTGASGGTPYPDSEVNGGLNAGDMLASSIRALCVRVMGPSASTTVDTQTIQVFVTAANP